MTICVDTLNLTKNDSPTSFLRTISSISPYRKQVLCQWMKGDVTVPSTILTDTHFTSSSDTYFMCLNKGYNLISYF